MSNPTEIKDFIPNAELLRPDSPLREVGRHRIEPPTMILNQRNTGTVDEMPPDNLTAPAATRGQIDARGIRDMLQRAQVNPVLPTPPPVTADELLRQRLIDRADDAGALQIQTPLNVWTERTHNDMWRAALLPGTTTIAPDPPTTWDYEERVILRVPITRLRSLHRQICELILHMDRNHQHEMLVQSIRGRPFDYTIGEFGIKDLGLPVPQNPAHVPEMGYPPQTNNPDIDDGLIGTGPDPVGNSLTTSEEILETNRFLGLPPLPAPETPDTPF